MIVRTEARGVQARGLEMLSWLSGGRVDLLCVRAGEVAGEPNGYRQWEHLMPGSW